jgi:hypothetical protein
MMRFGETLKPIQKDLEYVGTAHGVSSKKFRRELKELKKSAEK